MPSVAMLHERDPAEILFEEIGDLGPLELFHNQVLVAIYVRPEKTAKGLYMTQQTRDEDKTQGKVGLVVKLGASAFESDEKWEFPDIKIGDWVYFRASDGWAITVNQKLCRIVDDVDIRGRVQHPDQVW